MQERPTAFELTPHYVKHVITAFTIADPSGKIIKDRDRVIELIYSQYPGVSRKELQSADFVYSDYYYVYVSLPQIKHEWMGEWTQEHDLMRRRLLAYATEHRMIFDPHRDIASFVGRFLTGKYCAIYREKTTCPCEFADSCGLFKKV